MGTVCWWWWSHQMTEQVNGFQKELAAVTGPVGALPQQTQMLNVLCVLPPPAASQAAKGSMPVRQFLQTCAAVINREPAVFFEAVRATCTIQEASGRPHVVLKKPKVRSPRSPKPLNTPISSALVCMSPMGRNCSLCAVAWCLGWQHAVGTSECYLSSAPTCCKSASDLHA